MATADEIIPRRYARCSEADAAGLLAVANETAEPFS
jgi:hypothetical protein